MSYSMESIREAAARGDFDTFQRMLNCTPGALEEFLYGEKGKVLVQSLDYEFQQMEQQAFNIFKKKFIESYPEACIKASIIWKLENDERSEMLFLSQEDLQEWLDGLYEGEYNAYCQGYGDPTLAYYHILVTYPDGKEEKIGDW